MSPSNLLTEWAGLLLGSFADAGVRDVVVSPGSRSTPFVVAAVREERLTCHSVIDERAGAFFALGQARLTRRASLLVCTSGTAGAHYLPAIIEAGASFLPLLILTADRPTELQECSAPQTIDQLKLFGGHVRQFFDLGMPDPTEGSLVALRRFVAQAVFRSTWPTPGPVHLNARVRKPLEPVQPDSEPARRLSTLTRTIRSTAITTPIQPVTAPDVDAIHTVAEWCCNASRGLIVCGPAPAWVAPDSSAVFALAAATGFPIAPEVTSQLRFSEAPPDTVVVDAFDTLFRSPVFREQATVDLIVHVGAPPVSAGWELFMARCKARRVILNDHGWCDPQGTAACLIVAQPTASARALVSALNPRRPLTTEHIDWKRFIVEANDAAWRAIDAELAARNGALTEGHCARVIGEKLPRQSILMTGNSLAVRLLDTFCRQAVASVTVVSQRGVSGIDGLIAGAAGAATKTTTAVTLVVGDVSFLHDMTSLLLARRSQVPLVVVVLQNHGGRIFEQLPLASVQDLETEILDLTTTPHSVDFSHAARAFDVRWEQAKTENELRQALQRAYATPGCTVVEALVVTHGAVEQHRRIWATADAAIAGRTGHSPA